MLKKLNNIFLLSFIILFINSCEYSRIRYYSILQFEDLNNQQNKNINNIKNESVGISTVELSKVLNRPQIVFKISDSELKFEEISQWGGQLQEDVTQFVINELRKNHEKYNIFLYPSENRAKPKYQWFGEIKQLYGKKGANSEIYFEGNCRIFDKNDGSVKFENQSSLVKKTEGDQIEDYINAQRWLLKEWLKKCWWQE